MLNICACVVKSGPASQNWWNSGPSI